MIRCNSSILKRFLIISLLCFSLFSCKKKKKPDNHPVPSVPVKVSIYPNDPLNFKLQSIGGWIYYNNVGINGIIVYRKSEEEFVAIERSSSYLPNDTAARAYVRPDNFILLDTISHSRWRIVDGGVVKGPAEWPLRLYGATYDGNVLRITN